MGSQKPPQPVRSSGAVAVCEKFLDTGKLAAQVSDMVADRVVNKLMAIGLTAENIKKLEQLEAVPPLDAVGGGSQVASLADAVFSQLTAIGLTEKNIKKLATLEGEIPSLTAGEGSQAARQPLHLDDTDNSAFPSSPFTEDPFNSSTWAESNWRGSLPSSQMSTCQPKHSEERPMLGDTSQSATSPSPQKKLHPFNTLPRRHDSPTQFFRQQKRAALPEVITREETMCRRPKKKKRQDEADDAKNEFLTESDADTHTRESQCEKRSQRSRTAEFQVDSSSLAPLTDLFSPGFSLHTPRRMKSQG